MNSRNTKQLAFALFVAPLFGAFGEAPVLPPAPATVTNIPVVGDPNAPPAAAAVSAAPKKATVLDQLGSKLKQTDGTSVRVGVVRPLDYTGVKLADNVKKIILRGFTRFSDIAIVDSDYKLDALTLESFRIAAIRTNSDILIASVLKASGFEAFLYDRRNPYVIYTYAHTLPDARIHKYNKDIVIKHTKQLLARLLNNYVKDHFYELPRGKGRDIASFEGDLGPSSIDRSPAATEMYFAANRDRIARFYGAAGVGYVLLKGNNGAFNSSTLVGTFGVRTFGQWYTELGLEMTTYNLATLSMKYLKESTLTHWRYLLGLGVAFGTAKYTANWDQTDGFGFTNFYVVPSGAILFPVSRTAYIKAETRIYMGLDFSKFIVSFAPSLLVRF